MIYIVNGFPGCGKTTFENRVCKIMGEEIFGYKNSTIDFVKDLAKQCGWDGEKTPKNRKFLSDLKDLLTEWNDVPFNLMKTWVSSIKDKLEYMEMPFNKCAIFIDCREPKEIKRLCEEFDAKSLFVWRPNLELEISNHADLNVLDYDYDIIIYNDKDLASLTQRAFDFIQSEHLYMPVRHFQIGLDGEIKNI